MSMDLPEAFRRTRSAATLLVASAVIVLMAAESSAQQNLFNVPIPDTAEPFELFLQEQVNVLTSGNLGTSNTTIDYGLTPNFEIGINLFNVQLYPGGHGPELQNADQSAFLVNGQQTFELLDDVKIGLGTQIGMSSRNARNQTDFLDFNYLTGMYQPASGEFGRYVVGAYYGNESYLGNGNNAGYMLGAEIPILPDQVSFLADYISGTNNSSVFVVGAVLNVWWEWQFSLGVQLQSPGSQNGYGLVFELTRVPGLKALPIFGPVVNR